MIIYLPLDHWSPRHPTLQLAPRVHALVLVMQQLVFLLLLFQLSQLLLQCFLKCPDYLLVFLLHLRDLDLSFVQDFVLDLHAVAFHRDIVPWLETAFEGLHLALPLASVLHWAQVFLVGWILFPRVEEGFLRIFGIKKRSKVLNLITFLLHLALPTIIPFCLKYNKLRTPFDISHTNPHTSVHNYQLTKSTWARTLW